MLLSDRQKSLSEEPHDECLDRLDNHLKSKRELLEVVRPRYLQAKKLEKQKMLDEFTSATGYHRKHAIRVLKNQVQVQNHLKRKSRTYKTIYGGEVVQALEQIWEICGQICSKRLQPYLPEAIKVLERCKEIELSEDTKELLLKISSASIDRCLHPIRCKSPHGLSTTKPGSLLKNLIPVQTPLRHGTKSDLGSWKLTL
jgi:hypothetical protein